jgi:Rps23 Pro-64 3,4-dihydroxylase Tpa1-like proline 4-hydroxylase
MSIFVNNFIYPTDLTPKILGGCIAVFHNAMPNCEILIDNIEQEVKTENTSLYWEKAESYGEQTQTDFNKEITTYRNNYLINLSKAALRDSPSAIELHNAYAQSIISCSVNYIKHFEITEQLYHEQYQLLKYAQGQKYSSHYDGSPSNGRMLSVICYLNDGYEGGGLFFKNQNITIKPQKGDVVLFPSNYAFVHESLPIVSGTKYSLVTWIHDREINR